MASTGSSYECDWCYKVLGSEFNLNRLMRDPFHLLMNQLQKRNFQISLEIPTNLTGLSNMDEDLRIVSNDGKRIIVKFKRIT